ncbi:hypothetical protein VTN77DRAFT_2259 [Rasamsonia byssochlamydoides]|uniref:uncharacterized protein n=1 Tax=Rasamsonia byssochlamydoides TaxID=89139 RepID=UPI0037445792
MDSSCSSSSTTTPNGISHSATTTTPTTTAATATATTTQEPTTTTDNDAPAPAVTIPPHLDPTTYPRIHHIPDENIHIELTYSPLDTNTILARVSSPSAGANVLFLGTTRDTFEGRAVAQLSYVSYAPLALRTLTTIAKAARQKHGLVGVCIVHRLGTVPVGQASIAIAVSAAHRRAAWRAGEDVLEECKAKAEIWKREEFVGEEPEQGEWRANRERDADGKWIVEKTEGEGDGQET